MSTFLFAVPSRLYGASRVLDLFGQFDAYNVSASRAEADERALWADWLAVGDDLQESVQKFDRQGAE